MKDEELSWLPWLLQTADALFPTGAYAHSLGFEESVRLGQVRDEGSLLEFIQRQIVPAQTRQELPHLRYAFAAETVDDLCAIDREISAWKLAREAREASAQLGGRRLKALRNISNYPVLAEFEDAIQKGRAIGHHLVVCGLQARVESMPLAAALTIYYYQSLAAICAAAMKLIRIGQEGCQRVLRATSAQAKGVVATSLDVAREDAGCFNPLLEIASMRHERADERLFISCPRNPHSRNDPRKRRAVRIGIGGPVGSGKTMLVLRLCQWLRGELSLAVVTNDIYTREDAEFLVRNEALPAERVIGVETGGCPHTAIRDDTSMNMAAIAELEKRHPDVQVILVESGGDNLSATFSPELVEAFIYVIDVAEGDKIPRKGGPAIRHSDLLLINKIELAPYVGADLKVMERDAKLMRGERPFIFADLRSEKGKEELLAWLRREVLFV